MPKVFNVRDFAHESGDWLKWTRLPLVNSCRVLSLTTNLTGTKWDWECYNDPRGTKAKYLKSLGKPPAALARLLGARNFNGSVKMVLSVKFHIWSPDPCKPNPLITLRCRSEKCHLYVETLGNMQRAVGAKPGSLSIGIMDCAYGRAAYDTLNKRYTIKQKPKE
jgi:hypothetical protein